MRLIFGTRYVYGLCRTAETSGKAIDPCDSNTRACTILARAKFVPNGFPLLGGLIFAVGHDTGSLGVAVLVVSVGPGIPIAPSDEFSRSRSVYDSHIHTCHTM